MSDGAERRVQSRIQLKTMISVTFESKLFIGRLIDLNKDGIALAVDAKFKKGRTLTITFPGTAEIGKNQVEAQVWRCELLSGASYKVVALFITPNSRYLEDVDKLLQNL